MELLGYVAGIYLTLQGNVNYFPNFYDFIFLYPLRHLVLLIPLILDILRGVKYNLIMVLILISL